MSGLHHVTAIAGNPLRNLDFYSRTLGLRLVKRTVNFDGPGTYHFYYGDETGRPGTILTFFPWEHAGKGRVGVERCAGAARGSTRRFRDPVSRAIIAGKRCRHLRSQRIPAGTSGARLGPSHRLPR